MVKKVFGIILGLLSLLFVVTPAFAQAVNPCPQGGSFGGLCNLNFNNIGPFIGKIIIILLIVAIIISLIFLIYGGIKWIISGGDKTAVESARNHIIAAIVGLIIALLAFFIVQFVLGLLGISLTDLQFPRLI